MHTNTQAYSALADQVRQAKSRHGALSRVTILCPTNAGCLDATRYLAHTLTEFAGLVNVHATTLSELAATLFHDSTEVSGRGPVTHLLREAAARNSLQQNPGSFAKLATRHATVEAVARTSELMDFISPDVLANIAPDSLTAEIAHHHRTIREILGERCYFEDEVLSVAMSELSNGKIQASLGELIFFQLNTPANDREHEFLIRLTQELNPHLIAGAFDLDSPGITNNELTGSLVKRAEIINTTDADEEAKAIVRLVVDELNNGTPGHKIAIFMPSATPYRALLDRHLGEAGVAWAGSSTRQLIDTSVARSVLRFLTCPPDEFDYRLVLDAMAERALVNADPKFPTPAQAERDYRHIANDEDDEQELTRESHAAQQRRALFRDYVAALQEEIQAALESTTWSSAANAVQSLVNTHFTPTRFRTVTFGNDDFDTPAVWRQEFDLAIASLGFLDDVAPVPTPQAITDQLEAAIQQRYLRHGKQGVGVVLSTLESAQARDLDVVIICGLVEGVAPTRIFENPLFSDDIIAELGNPISTSRERSRQQTAQFTQAMLCAHRRVILTYPRGNLRGGEQRVVSRWISSHFDTEQDIQPVEVGSFLEGVLTGLPAGPIAVTSQARDIAKYRHMPELLHSLEPGTDLFAAVTMRGDRHNGRFTVFNGNLSSAKEDITVLNRAISPTALERYRQTPLSFFFHDVLRVTPLNDVIQSPTLDAITRGTLIHEVLELWVVETIEKPESHALGRLLEICEEVCDRYREEVGTHWIEQYWLIDKFEIEEDIAAWFNVHEALREEGWKPIAAEAKFGTTINDQIEDAVTIHLHDDQGVLQFKGQIDRIDKHSADIRVIDYKGSRTKTYDKIEPGNITADGTKFQLGVYAMLAKSMVADEKDQPEVLASYWFVRRDKGKREKTSEQTLDKALITVELNATAELELTSQLTRLNNDVRGGAFPPIPSTGNYDTYTNLIGRQRMETMWGKVANDERLTDITTFWQEHVDSVSDDSDSETERTTESEASVE